MILKCIYRFLRKLFFSEIKKKRTRYGNCMKGKFKPKHPEKYKGNPTNIIYRSRWEMVVMSKLDNHLDVIWWQSEEFYVPYRSPVDNKIHRYFVDFACKIQDKDGKHRVLLIEVKPKNQVLEPKKPKKMTKSFITEALTWTVNQAKWEAARRYCEERDYEFFVITEDDIFGKLPIRKV